MANAAEIKAQIRTLEQGNPTFYEDACKTLELSKRLFSLFVGSALDEKANILKLLASNYVLNDLSIVPIYRKPFDVIAKGPSRLNWLPGRDSNPRPIGYKDSDISVRLGLSHHPPKRMSGAVEVYWMGSSTSSLCTFLSTDSPSTGFAQDYRRGKWDFLLRLP